MDKPFICLLFICLSGFIYPAQSQSPVRLELDKGWFFRQYRLGEWLPATVPGTVHTDLLANGKIGDPFYRTNEQEMQWVDKVDWEYETSFTIGDSTYNRQNKRLTFYGLDTYADIFLNDQSLGSTDNMFRTWSFDIGDKLQKGNNRLKIVFRSPIRQGLEEMAKYGLRLPADNDQSVLGGVGPNRVSVFTRKAPYSYGWDWGPRLVTSGIWRPVVLESWDDLKIEDIFIRQLKVDKKNAQLNTEITLTVCTGKNVNIEITNNRKVMARQNVDLKSGTNRIGLPVNIRNPRLWWCNGLGEPNLYTFEIKVSENKRILESRTLTTGLRTIRLIRRPDTYGETFYFELNGVPVFAKGTNYIPSDVFLPRVSRTDYEKVIADAADAHLNMIRVWGGGVYENDYFYELCDRNGLLVWQDFMFACAMYPGTPDFLENVRQEVIDNVVRLRNHPCLALWCGNNEIGGAWHHGSPGGWGWKEKYTEEQQEKIFKAYSVIFHHLLPETVEKYSDGIAYWPSSPMSGPEELDFEQQPGTRGDNHYWGVWHGKHRLEEYAGNIGRFISEYGFQSFPEFETVKKYTLPADHDIESEVMASHQRSGIGNLRIREYMDWYYRLPKDFGQFLYMSQVLQAKAMKTALQAHRRAKPYCMGSLFWQLNDSWPVASWSTTDYYHNWKAAHYAIREACKPVLLVPRLEKDELELWVVNDRLKKIQGSYSIQIQDFQGHKSEEINGKFTAEANRSEKIGQFRLKALLKNVLPQEVVAVLILRKDNRMLDEQHFFFVPPKELQLPSEPQITIRPGRKNGKTCLSVQTDRLACDVMFYVPDKQVKFSENYIDLLPGRTYTIECDGLGERDEVKFRYIP